MPSYQCLDGLDDAVLHPKAVCSSEERQQMGLGPLAQDVQPAEVARTGHGMAKVGHVPTSAGNAAVRERPSLHRLAAWQLRCKSGSMGKLSNADHLSGMSRRHFGQATVAVAAGILLTESAVPSASAQASNVALVHGHLPMGQVGGR